MIFYCKINIDQFIITSTDISYYNSNISPKFYSVFYYRNKHQSRISILFSLAGQNFLPCTALPRYTGQGRAKNFVLPWSGQGRATGQGRAVLPCDGL